MNTEMRMNTATDKVVQYMYREEDRHFRESLENEDKKDPVVFMAKLKEHIFYSVVVMSFRGDATKLNEWFNDYWGDYGEPDDEDEDEDKFTCDLCKKTKDKEEYISIDGDESGNTICLDCYDEYIVEKKIFE